MTLPSKVAGRTGQAARPWTPGGDGPQLLAGDPHDAALLAHVHPNDWTNPVPARRYDLVVIGGGTAGLVTAAGAAGLGARVALVERQFLGGDCLNVGCVPSKALIRSSRVAADLRDAGALGFRVPPGAEADFPAVMERLRRIRAGIGHHDSAARFTSLGVDVFLGSARFTSSDTVDVDGTRLRFKKAVLATGARALIPPIEGLAAAGCLTNETVFTLTQLPRRLAVIGGGPIGCELAQAFRRLGSEVTLLHRAQHVLDREDADAAAVVLAAFQHDGLRVELGAETQRVELTADGKRLSFTSRSGGAGELTVDAVLAAAGRAPNVEGLGLDVVGVDHDSRRGIVVDDRLRTTNPRIFAAGDCCLPWKFTHAADFAARIVIQNALFLGRKRLSDLVVPWTTYTDPEVAHVGLQPHQAEAKRITVRTFVRRFTDVDRAITDGETEGFVKVHVREGTDRILGATIVARHAGEMIGEIVLAMSAGVGLGRLASVIHPYPTQAEAIRQAGDAFNRTRLTPRVSWLLRTFLKLTR